MERLWWPLAVGSTTLLLALALSDAPTRASAPAGGYDFRAERLARSYDRWRAATYPEAGRYEIVTALSWFPGVSAERSRARGLASIDMVSGTLQIEVGGIDLERLAEVWLIDNRPGEGSSAMPDAGDVMRRVGNLSVDAGAGRLSANLGPAAFHDFDVDQVVVARRGEGPVEGGVLYGSLPLFERLYRMSWRVGEGLSPVAGGGGRFASFPRPSIPAASSPGALLPLGGLLEQGEDLFDNEIFEGNGRTCATCHPAENNFTLDKAFISRLPPDDPLFVAEFIDELNHELNGGLFFENPVLMREFALIVENPDGFDDLANQFVMRSPNHVFAQALQLQPADTDCTPVPPVHRLGWGGDGAAGSGSLREFAIGAVIQHAPLTLGRVEGVDFRLPTDEELDAMEAFQLSLGRQEEIDLDRMFFTDPNVTAGQDLFLLEEGGGKCFLCHGNAGALRPPEAHASPLQNMQFDVGIFNVEHPAEPLGEPLPFDDGFGESPFPPVLNRCFNTFSPPSLIEAADTAPYFHNNVFGTLEEAIAHYSTEAFNELSHGGSAIDSPPVDLTVDQNNQIGALLRVLNALQNMDDVLACDARVLASTGAAESRRLLRLCVADNRDALEVLARSPLGPLHPAAQNRLRASLDLHRQALQAPTPAARDAALNAVPAELSAARAEMIIEDP
jgi:hypothetical protein